MTATGVLAVMKDVWSDAVIARARAGDMATLLRLDALGVLIAPGEDAEDFAGRLTRLRDAERGLREALKRDGTAEPVKGIVIRPDAEIPRSIRLAAWRVTERLYGVRPEWVAGFFVNERFGFLWGGCSLSEPGSGLNLFIIRRVFRKKQRWLCYDRTELLAHELCHAARQALDDWRFEEYFAYRTARSGLRRRFGSCFVHPLDAWGFLLPVMLLPVMQFLQVLGVWPGVMWPFWILAGVFPVFLLYRNGRTRSLARRAERRLREMGIAAPGAVLFRLTAPEIAELARAASGAAAAEFLLQVWKKDLRGAVLQARFAAGQ